MPFIKNLSIFARKVVAGPRIVSPTRLDGGDAFSVFIKTTGRVFGWGSNASGQIDGSGGVKLTPVSIGGAAKTFCQITSGNFHAAAIDKNGRAWAWGNNGTGQLGDNSVNNRTTPVSVLGAVKTFCLISAGNNFTVGLEKNGRVWGWGNNFYGQLGDGTSVSKRTPVSVGGATKTFCEIATSKQHHTVAIDRNGRAWGWGWNVYGQLGDNTGTSRLTPVSVVGAVKTFCKIAAGQYFTVALDKNGRAWGWGYNANSQLGDNSITSRLTPVSIAGATKTFCKIGTTLGVDFVNAIDKNGRVWSWGSNILGQLGDNTTLSRRTPVAIVGNLKTFCHISSGLAYFAVALDNRGRAWAWGSNGSGQLGNNSLTSQRTPVSVLGAIKTFCKIFAGNSHVTAIDKNGRIWTWGGNISGQLGINEFLRRTPVRVCTL